MSKMIKKSDLENTKQWILSVIYNPIVYLVILTALVISAYLLKYKTSISYIVILSAMIVYTVIAAVFEGKNKRRRLYELTKGFNSSVGNTLKDLEIPIAYIDDKGKIIWESKEAEDLDLKEYMGEILGQINKANQKSRLAMIDMNNKKYEICASNIYAGNLPGKIVLFIERTKEHEQETIMDNTRVTVGIIAIDNFDEIISGVDELVKLNMLAQIDKQIAEWVSEYFGVISKIEKDKYVYIIEKQYVKQFEEVSFEILEKIKKISDGVLKVPITISLGLSYDEDTLSGRYKSSATALDVALGRGGNQAVVKVGKKYDIYGTGAKALDKTNRVKSRTIAQALKDLISKSDDVYIMGHKNTDIDCIGAAVGIYKIVLSLGKEAKIIVDAKYNNSTKMVMDRLKSGGNYDDVFITREETKKIDTENSLLVIVDTHKESYLAAPDVLKDFDKKVIIDHHRRGPEFIEDAILVYHEVYASSTSELVTELLIYSEEVEITSKEAEVIYAGILVDTKNFTFKTGVRTFEAAAYLRKAGLDIAEVKHIFQNDFETYLAKVEIVRAAEMLDSQIAISICENKHKDMAVLAAQAADELLTISGILASFVICEIDNVIMISGRSIGDINVQAILETLGGGGHLTFAGAQIAGATVEEAKELLISAINNYMGKNEK